MIHKVTHLKLNIFGVLWVKGSVGGNVEGDIWADVWGSVLGDVCGDVCGDVKNKVSAYADCINKGYKWEFIEQEDN